MRPYYESQGITIYHASYQELLPSLRPNSVDLLLTDPPYGTTNLQWDKPVDWRWFWPIIEQICKCYANLVLFSSGQFTHTLIASNRARFRYELIWEKPMPAGFLSANRRPLRAHENILLFNRSYKHSVYNPQFVKGKMHMRGNLGSSSGHYGAVRRTPGIMTNKYHPRSILRFSKPLGTKSLHPTQKPLELMRWLVRSYSRPRQQVLDPFIGSGTTLVAAQMTGRRAIGVDVEERFCEIAANRLRQL
jgi:site-specific DNA-methyltransferase (adenine-specific)